MSSIFNASGGCLAAAVIEKEGHALDPPGEFFSKEISVRNFMAELHSGGLETGSPSSFNRPDRTAFANQMDRLLARHALR